MKPTKKKRKPSIKSTIYVKSCCNPETMISTNPYLQNEQFFDRSIISLKIDFLIKNQTFFDNSFVVRSLSNNKNRMIFTL